MNCEQVRLLLAVSPREWSAAERAQVDAHLASCAACAALAVEYAAQEIEIGHLPHVPLSPARQDAVLARVRGEAGWQRRRLQLSNALGAASAALLVLCLALALSALFRHPPGPVALSTATVAPSTPEATTEPAVTPTPAPFTVEPPGAPAILVDNGPRSGLGSTEPFPHPNLYAVLGEGNYRVRYRFAESGIQPQPGVGIESPPITAADLAGVDLLVVPWTSCYAAGGGAEGPTVYDFNLTAEEAQTIREFVAGGGRALFVLDPTYQCHFEALQALGIEADVARAVEWSDGLPHAGEGHLPEGGGFELAAHYRFQPVSAPGGETWARLQAGSGESGALVVQAVGTGRVAVLGARSMVDGMRSVSEEIDQGQPAPLFAADNLAFLVGVVEELSGAPSGLDVAAIAWEERMAGLRAGTDRLAGRLAFWTEDRITWAAREDEEETQSLAAQVNTLQDRLDRVQAALDTAVDPGQYDGIRGSLVEVLSGLDGLEDAYGQQARESWEARQQRRLQPVLLGLLGGGLLLGLAAWRVRRIDVTPAVVERRVTRLLPYAAAALLLVALLLAAADMLRFGLCAGGYPLNRWGVWGYAATTLLAAAILISPAGRRARPGVSGLTRLALPLLAVLALMQAEALTGLIGAEYAVYGDYEEGLVLIANLLVALAFCLAGLLYRRPGWLAAIAGVHLTMALGVVGGNSLSYALRDGFAPWQLYQLAVPPSPLPYLAILYGLGWLAARPARRRTYWTVDGALLGLFVALGTLLFVRDVAWMHSSAPAVLDWLANLLLIPLLLAVGVVSVAYWWSTQRAVAGRLPVASPLAATVLLVGLAALLAPVLLSPNALPASGAAMPWRGADYRVPADAWTLLLPTARVLSAIAPWLVLVSIVLLAWQRVRRRVGRRGNTRLPETDRR